MYKGWNLPEESQTDTVCGRDRGSKGTAGSLVLPVRGMWERVHGEAHRTVAINWRFCVFWMDDQPVNPPKDIPREQEHGKEGRMLIELPGDSLKPTCSSTTELQPGSANCTGRK